MITNFITNSQRSKQPNKPTKPSEKHCTTDPLNGMISKPFGAGGRGVSLQIYIYMCIYVNTCINKQKHKKCFIKNIFEMKPMLKPDEDEAVIIFEG